VGFAQLRWGKAPSCVVADAPGEIHRLYVARDSTAKCRANSRMPASMSWRAVGQTWLARRVGAQSESDRVLRSSVPRSG
jgi:hypothetical protein